MDKFDLMSVVFAVVLCCLASVVGTCLGEYVSTRASVSDRKEMCSNLLPGQETPSIVIYDRSKRYVYRPEHGGIVCEAQ